MFDYAATALKLNDNPALRSCDVLKGYKVFFLGENTRIKSCNGDDDNLSANSKFGHKNAHMYNKCNSINGSLSFLAPCHT